MSADTDTYEPNPQSVAGNIELAIDYAKRAGASNVVPIVESLAALASAHAAIAQAMVAQNDFNRRWQSQ
jgi:hypothetical protein